MSVLARDHDEEDCSDYTLADGVSSCWITVGNISIYIFRGDERVHVDMYPKGDEFGDQLDSACAPYPATTFECPHCGRVYEDGPRECTSDDCPGKEEES